MIAIDITVTHGWQEGQDDMDETPPPLTLDDHLCYAIYSAGIAINRAYKPMLDALDITYPQYLVLLTLWAQDALTIGAIAERLALEPSTITPLVKRLERADLLSRERNPGDERQVIVRLTEQGRAMQQRASCLPATLLTRSRLSLDQLRQLNHSVSALRDAVAGG
jgi:DNA-binding MarR family transcriptional regulator